MFFESGMTLRFAAWRGINIVVYASLSQLTKGKLVLALRSAYRHGAGFNRGRSLYSRQRTARCCRS